MKKYLLPLLFVPTLHAMQQEKEEIIHGILTVEPFQGAWYNLEVQNRLIKQFNIPMDKNEPMLFVKAFCQDGSDHIPLYLGNGKEFPPALPLHILKDKKEGETLELITYDNKKVILTCKEALWVENSWFEKVLTDNIRRFRIKPQVHLFNEQELIKAQIIQKDNDEDNWQHGPNGYSFDSSIDSYSDSEEDESEVDSWSFSSDDSDTTTPPRTHLSRSI